MSASAEAKVGAGEAIESEAETGGSLVSEQKSKVCPIFSDWFPWVFLFVSNTGNVIEW